MDHGLTRRRMIAAAAAHGWAVGPTPRDAPGDGIRRAYPRTVGSVVVPRRPVRPFAARTLMELDTLLALGVVPAAVGSRGGVGEPAWRAVAAEADIPVVDLDRPEHVIERLAELGIDLVVTSSVLAAVPEELDAYGRLGVPVLTLPADDVGGQLRLAGAALDLDARAARIADRSRHAVPDRASRPRSLAVFTGDLDGAVHLVTATSPLGRLLRAYGLPDPAGSGAHGRSVVRAKLSDLDVDLVIGLELTTGMLERIEADPRFARLPAVRAGSYRRLDPAASYALCVPSVLTVGIANSVLESVLAT